MPTIAPQPEPFYADSTITLHHGDCLDVLRELPDASVDAVCTDPPYDLTANKKGGTGAASVNLDSPYGRARIGTGNGSGGFMGKAWDSTGIAFTVELWTECLRVLKPGGHLLAFGGTRTWHRMAVAIDDAGFEVRDSIAWLYGSGFPKSLDVSKAIDKAAGAERDVLGVMPDRWTGKGSTLNFATDRPQSEVVVTGDPATDDARTWQGWGTALKPAFEPVVVARKPLAGTVAANVQAHGTGALNIDGCRVGYTSDADKASARPGGKATSLNGALAGKAQTCEPNGSTAPSTPAETRATSTSSPTASAPSVPTMQPTSRTEFEVKQGAGRWPANVVLDESQAAALDEQSGDSASRSSGLPPGRRPGGFGDVGADKGDPRPAGTQHDDFGGASRFFFIAREDQPCPSINAANTAATPSSRPSEPADSAPSGAATTACPDGERQTGSPSTSGTPNASRPNAASDTRATPPIGSGSSLDSQPARLTPIPNPASSAEPSLPTDTTTTTTSPSTSDGFADPTTSSTTPNSVPGVPLDELGSRFTYIAKASADERVRVNGTAHPTVKPLALMRWLVRLVTPPGGTVLEPFAGSGTTVEACILEGFRCVAIEREADYLPLIVQRINRRRDPVAAVKAQGEDGGLFDLLGEATA